MRLNSQENLIIIQCYIFVLITFGNNMASDTCFPENDNVVHYNFTPI